MEVFIIPTLLAIAIVAAGAGAAMITNRKLRGIVVAGLIVVSMVFGGIAAYVSAYIDYNAKYTFETKTLLNTLVADLHDGNCARATQHIEKLNELFVPSYERGPSYFMRTVQFYKLAVERPESKLLESATEIP